MEQSPPTLDERNPCDLILDIKSSPEFITLLADDSFCSELWNAFANIEWVKRCSPNPSDEETIIDILSEAYLERTWSASFRGMAGIIADLRNQFHGKNENYMDWYCSSDYPYGVVSERVANALGALGWDPVKDHFYYEANS